MLMATGSAGIRVVARTMDPALVAKPSDVFICRYKDGFEEALSLTKLRQLGASFKFPRIGLINADGADGDGEGGDG
ncbi:unnamed protein product, partial [Laminaria digitata]